MTIKPHRDPHLGPRHRAHCDYCRRFLPGHMASEELAQAALETHLAVSHGRRET